jgi:hypothetical protein
MGRISFRPDGNDDFDGAKVGIGFVTADSAGTSFAPAALSFDNLRDARDPPNFPHIDMRDCVDVLDREQVTRVVTQLPGLRNGVNRRNSTGYRQGSDAGTGYADRDHNDHVWTTAMFRFAASRQSAINASRQGLVSVASEATLSRTLEGGGLG